MIWSMMEKRRLKTSLYLFTTLLIAAFAITECAGRIIEAGRKDVPGNATKEAPKINETPGPDETPAPSPSPAASAGLSEAMVRKFMDEKHRGENMLDCFIEDFDNIE